MNVGLLGLTLILLIVFFPETKWDRARPAEIENEEPKPSANATSKSEILQDENVTVEAIVDVESYVGKGYPSRQQFWLWQPAHHSFKEMLDAFWTPWKLFSYPIVLLASINVAFCSSTFLISNVTQSQAFAAAPYNFSSQTIGFFNFATLAGAFIGLATNGPLSDWISMRATKKNRGIREPEMRLPAMIPYVIITVIGSFVMAFGYQHQWDWKVSAFIPHHFIFHTFL